MTAGIVIFAQNNSKVDYIKLATYTACRARDYLQVPVSIITDSPGYLVASQPDHPFDKIIEIHNTDQTQKKHFQDGKLFSTYLEWKNFARNQAYELSPYDKTMVIDSDYIINSSMLKSAFEGDADLQIYSESMDLAVWRPTKEFERINDKSIKFYWATVFVFQKNLVTESFFNLISYIRSNWNYYRMLYNIDTQLFRNDYAFSIAIHIINGNSENFFVSELPGKMIYTRDTDLLVEANNQSMKFLLEKQNYPGEYQAIKTQGLDVHIMNKFSLSRFIDGGSGV